MSKYNTRQELLANEDEKLLIAKLTFNSMIKGVMQYAGGLDGKYISCLVMNAYVSDYHYSTAETIRSLTDSCGVRIVLDGEVLLDVDSHDD